MSNLLSTRIFQKLKDRHLADTLSDLWQKVSVMPTKERKRLVLLCRAQEVVYNDPHNLLCIQAGLTYLPTESGIPPEEKRFFHFIRTIEHLIKSPVTSSIVLDICRSAPLDPSEVEAQKLKSWGKEIAICERSEDSLSFDYSCWFVEGCESRPIVAGIPPNPSMAYRIRLALEQWKRQVSDAIHYPRMSRKQVSSSTMRDWERISGRKWEVDEREGGVEMTQETLEKIYHQYGIEVMGSCEIRQKWYKSGLVPRTYFAQGGTAYSKAKHIQGMAGMLTEQLSSTHPILRLSPARIRLRSSSSYLRIYDLTGFTSNHCECKHFLDQLALWCHDTEVSIVDAREGLVRVNLGVLLSSYNQSMNYTPGYSMERMDPDLYLEEFFHNRAGFLGVYGNINFSTFVHGASLLMIVQSEDEANIAGDDAHYSEEPGFEDVSDRVIAANGITEPTKEFRADQIGAVCLKRGVIQVDQRCLPKQMIVFPSFANLGSLFRYNPPQFPRKDQSRTERIRMVGAELFRFLRGLFLSGIRTHLDEVHDILRAYYECASLPKLGSLPPYSDTLIPALPDFPAELISISPLERLLHNHFSGGAVLPKIFEVGDVDDSHDPVLLSGGSWQGTMTSKLKYLEVLEYVTKEEITEALWGIDAYNRIIDIYSGVGSKLYTFHCICDVPVELSSLP